MIDRALRGFFRPEFLNRIDDVVVFEPLSKKEIVRIVELQLNAVQDRLKERRIRHPRRPRRRRSARRDGFDPSTVPDRCAGRSSGSSSTL